MINLQMVNLQNASLRQSSRTVLAVLLEVLRVAHFGQLKRMYELLAVVVVGVLEAALRVVMMVKRRSTPHRNMLNEIVDLLNIAKKKNG
jgi:hypothetical protein